MPEIDAESLVDQLALIGLISRDQLREARADAEDGSPESVVRSCLRKGWITSWQVDRLKKGDSGNFFFGPYRALFHLAEGTFARVYRGERSDTGQPVAIKVLRGRFASDPAAVASFHKEAEAGMKLRHDNIVRILDFGHRDDKHFMAMEYVEGMNLREFLRLRQRLRGDEALPLMIGLAEGLQYSHEHGIAHRDLKATNVLIANSGAAKLVDFGLANIEADGQGMKSQRTVDYSALERSCGSAKGDPRSDVFFLGCVFYNMLTGQVPLEDSESKDPLKKMLKRSFGGIRPISEHPYAPDPKLARIIEKMMKMDLKARYQSMAEVVADLETYRDGRFGTAAGAGSDGELAVDPELGSAIFRNPFLSNDPDAPPPAAPEPSESTADDALALDLATFETRPDDPSDLASILGLPADDVAEAPAPPDEPAPEVAAIAQTTLLCVEAQAEIQDALRKNLAKKGYRVLLIADAERAADRFRDGPTDLVLFDLDGLGPDAVRHLADMRAKAEEDGVPFRVLVILGPRQGALRDKLPPAEGLAVLSKPVKLKDVQDALISLHPPA